jgi:excisionase family DNA binding protein
MAIDDTKPPEPEWLSVDEAAAWLNVPRSSVYEQAKNGTLPGVVRIGRNIRIHRPTVLASASGEVRAPRSRRKA